MNNSGSHIFVVSMIMLLSACSNIKSTDNGNHHQFAERVFIRGIIQVNANHEEDSIRLCDTNRHYPIYLNDEIYEEAQKLSQLVKPFYAEVYGQFTSTFDSTVFNVTQLNLMSAETNLCKYSSNQSRAFGEEPFWSLALAENHFEYVELGKEKRQFELISQEISPNKRYYQANKARLSLVQKICRDNMTDSVYGWQAKLTQDDKILKGCAVISSSEMNAVEQ